MLCNTLDDQVPYANDFLRIDFFVLVLKNCVAFLIQTTEAFQRIFVISDQGNNDIAYLCGFLLLNNNKILFMYTCLLYTSDAADEL